MGRPSLSKTLGERDPQLIAQRVKAFRTAHGWSMRRFAKEAEIDVTTVFRIEHGMGCTAPIERKIAKTLHVSEHHLWIEQVTRNDIRISELEAARWYFANAEEGKKYCTVHNLITPTSPYRRDTEAIQDAAERSRLGHARLSAGFIRNTTTQGEGLVVASSVVEIYGRIFHQAPEGMNAYHYCLRGTIRIGNDGQEFVLHENDVVVVGIKRDYYHEPATPVKLTEEPPLLIYVELYPLTPF